MCDIMLESVCRLCLKEYFTLKCIFSYRCPSGEPVYRVLNYIYDLKVSQGDGLPSKICVPCLWRMFEFDTYKKNVNYAEAEMLKLLNKNTNNLNEISSEERIIGVFFGAEEVQTNDAIEVSEDVVDDSEVSIKQEIDIDEWEMPVDVQPLKDILELRRSERNFNVNETNGNVDNDFTSSDLISAGDYNIGECGVGNEESQANPKAARKALVGKIGFSSQKLIHSPGSYEANSSECVRGFEEPSENLCSEKGSCSVDIAGDSEINDTDVEIRRKGIENRNGSKDCVPVMKSKGGEEESEISNSEIQSKGKVYICDICEESFMEKNCLAQHIRVHYNHKPMKCRLCGKSFHYGNAKKLHEMKCMKEEIRKRNEEKGKPFSCDVCGKRFNSQSALCMHSNLHNNKYSCRFCWKSFGSNYNLQNHLRIHSDEKPFSCAFCKKTFREKGHMQNHMKKIHTEKRNFKCNFCDKIFRSQYFRFLHEFVHFKSS